MSLTELFSIGEVALGVFIAFVAAAAFFLATTTKKG